MNWDVIKGKWGQLKGKAREEWADLTDDDYDKIGGQKDQLIGKLQERYGYARDDAERRVDTWASRHAGPGTV